MHSLRSATALTAAASTTANLLSYAFNLVMTRALGVQGFGELAALLAIVIVAIVPGTALQATIARRITNAATPPALVRTTATVAAAVALGLVAVSPLLVASLHIHGYAPLIWTAAYTIPQTFAFAWQGILQGRRHFVGLGLLLVAVQLARVGGGVVAAIWHPTTSTALGAATVLTTVGVVAVAPHVLRLAPAETDRKLTTELLADGSPILAILVLSNLDLLLARHFLNPHDSGIYAAGNLLTRACFWGPAFIALSSYPQFAMPAHRRHALRHSVRLLALLAAIALVASIAGAELVPLVLGPGYRPVASVAWLFAATGLALAAVQLAVYAGLAVHDRRVGRLAWLVGAGEIGIVALWLHGSTRQIVGVALAGGLLLVAAAVTVELRRHQAPVPPSS